MNATRGQHLVGKVLGECVLEQLLGYGGSSAVFLAQHRSPGRKVAIKVFLPRSTLDNQVQKDFYGRFLHEAEAASELEHPNILPIYAYGEEEGLPYIVMPYMPGGTLGQYIAKNGCLSLVETQWYLDQLASALDYAHSHNCVHCDVKPANILLDSDGQVMLTDFGIAHLMQTDPISGNFVARANGMLLGTPDYISPEQALGRPLDGRSDIYSLGVLAFFLITGAVPFKAGSTIATALLHVYEPPPPLSQFRLDIPPEVDRVIQKALAKKPEERFQTAREFCAAFAGAVNDISAPTEVKNTARQARKLRRSLPPVSVQPARQPGAPRVRVLRLLVASILLVVITVAAAYATTALTSHFTNVHTTATPTRSNPLQDVLADASNWPVGNNSFFVKQQYHIQNNFPQFVALALYANHQYSGLHLSVATSEIHGSHHTTDFYGVVFRSTPDQSNYYVFEVVAWGGGQYLFLRYNGHWSTISSGPAPSLLTASSASNTLTVDATGNIYSFGVNGVTVASGITDPEAKPLTSGEVGLYVEDQGSEVVFSHLYITPSKATTP